MAMVPRWMLATSMLVGVATTAGAQPGVTEPQPTSAPVIHHEKPRLSTSRLATDREWGAGVRITGLSGVGALPGVNLGQELAGYLRHDNYFAELGFGHWAPQETYVVATAPERVELALDVWTLRAGWAPKAIPVRTWLLVEAGELAGTTTMLPGIARMVTGEMPSDRRWLAAGGGLGIAWPMADVARLVGSVELAIPIDRQPMMMDTSKPFEPEAAAARATLGIELGWR